MERFLACRRAGPAVLVLGAAIGVTPPAGHAHSAPEPTDGDTRIELDLRTLTTQNDIYVARVKGGGTARLTLSPALQAVANKILDNNAVPFGAAVVLSIPDGRVLALAGRSLVDPALGPAELALRAWAPAASIFKIISVSALANKGVGPDTTTCFHGGLRGIEKEHLRDDPQLDKQCESLALSLGRSQNAALAKLAVKYLDAGSLGRMAREFGFNVRIPFVADLEASMAVLPDDPLEFARAAAGFYHSTLSPLHGALIAATIANKGLMPRPLLIDSATGRDGKPRPVPTRRARRVLDETQAAAVGAMMETTVRVGTGKSGFYDLRGRPILPFAVAGKTGSLNYRGRLSEPGLPSDKMQDNYLQYSWFVGYAPYEKPEIAFATLVGNPTKWRIKAAYLARRLIETWMAEQTLAEASTKKTLGTLSGTEAPSNPG